MDDILLQIDTYNGEKNTIVILFYTYFSLTFLSMALCVVGIFVIMFHNKMGWRFVVHVGWILAGITSFVGIFFGME